MADIRAPALLAVVCPSGGTPPAAASLHCGSAEPHNRGTEPDSHRPDRAFQGSVRTRNLVGGGETRTWSHQCQLVTDTSNFCSHVAAFACFDCPKAHRFLDRHEGQRGI